MSDNEITGHYRLLAAIKRGEFPDGRTKIMKSIQQFRRWLREPYQDSWNTLQEAREAVALPWLAFWLLCPMVNKDGRLHADYVKASAHLERTIKDIAALTNKAPDPKVPTLGEWIVQQKENEKLTCPQSMYHL